MSIGNPGAHLFTSLVAASIGVYGLLTVGVTENNQLVYIIMAAYLIWSIYNFFFTKRD